MPSLIDPPSVSVSGRRVPALSPFRPVSPSSPSPSFAPVPGTPSAAPFSAAAPPRARKTALQGRSLSATRTVEAAEGYGRAMRIERGACCALAHPSSTLFLPPSLSLCLSLFLSFFLAGARMGLVLSRRYAARHPRKSTAGGRSRTAPEPQQPATHDPTDPTPTNPRLGLSLSSPVFHPRSAALLHPFVFHPCLCLTLSSRTRSFFLSLSLSLFYPSLGAASLRVPATFASILLSRVSNPIPPSFSHLSRPPSQAPLASIASKPPSDESFSSPFSFRSLTALSPCFAHQLRSTLDLCPSYHRYPCAPSTLR